jgi:urea carboxylase
VIGHRPHTKSAAQSFIASAPDPNAFRILRHSSSQAHFDQPWLLRTFDQIGWFPVGAEELLDMREQQAAAVLPLRIEHVTFRLADEQRAVAPDAAGIAAFQQRQQAAFAAERAAWASCAGLERAGG